MNSFKCIDEIILSHAKKKFNKPIAFTDIYDSVMQNKEFPVNDFDEVAARWRNKFRLHAVSCGGLRTGGNVAVLVYPDPSEPLTKLWKVVAPHDFEARLVQHYAEFVLQRWLTPKEIERMRETSEFDVYEGCNTIRFMKTEKGWNYSRFTWETPFYPLLSSETQYPDLLDLMDKIESDIDGIKPRWAAFKLDRGFA